MTRPKTTGKFKTRAELERYVLEQFAFGLNRNRIAVLSAVGRTTIDVILRGTPHRKTLTPEQRVRERARLFLARFDDAFPPEQFATDTESSSTLRKLLEARDQLREIL
jgi:hypothetical protein